MPVPEAVHLLARLRRIASVRVRHKREALCPSRFPVLGEEDSRDSSKALEHIPEILLLRKLRHVGNTERSQIVALAVSEIAGPRTSHGLAGGLALATEMGSDVAAVSVGGGGAEINGTGVVDVGASVGGSSNVVEGREGILERTAGGGRLRGDAGWRLAGGERSLLQGEGLSLAVVLLL